jgi:hypothetical protein
MSDLILVVLILAFFGASVGLIAACQRWMEG